MPIDRMRFHLAPLDRTGWAAISFHLVEREDGIVFKHAVADETYLPGARAPDTGICPPELFREDFCVSI